MTNTTKNPSAQNTLRRELREVQQNMSVCLTDASYVKSAFRYEYKGLLARSIEIKKSLDLLESLQG